jgi:hypothetical protein
MAINFFQNEDETLEFRYESNGVTAATWTLVDRRVDPPILYPYPRPRDLTHDGIATWLSTLPLSTAEQEWALAMIIASTGGGAPTS